MTISERLFSELERRNLTAYALCQTLGINTTTTTNWKQRGTDPPAKFLIPICEFLGCSLEYLLTGQETEKKPAPGISGNGLELLEYFEQLSEREQLLLIGESRRLLLSAEGKERASSHPAPSGAKAV